MLINLRMIGTNTYIIIPRGLADFGPKSAEGMCGAKVWTLGYGNGFKKLRRSGTALLAFKCVNVPILRRL